MTELGQEIYRGYDQWGAVQVFDDGHRRFLVYDDAEEQSCALKADFSLAQHQYVQAMLSVLLFSTGRRATVLGLGGGCLVTALYRRAKQLKLRAVELRPLALEVAQAYFGLPEGKRLQVLTGDASEFMAQHPEGGCDILFSDLYNAGGMLPLQLQPDFIHDCYRALNPGGWLVLNLWVEHKHQIVQCLDQIPFAELRTVATHTGNWIVLAGKQASGLSDSQLRSKAADWSHQLGFSLTPHLKRMRHL